LLFLQGEARLTQLVMDGLRPLLIPTGGCLPLVALCLQGRVLLTLLLDALFPGKGTGSPAPSPQIRT
jgi:hypothetical protein